MKKVLLHLVVAFVVVCAPLAAFAQLSGADTGLATTVATGYQTNATILTLPQFIGLYIIRPILGIVGTLLFLLMSYAGFLWLTAQGDGKKVQKAKDILTQCVVGTVILIGAYAMANFVITSLGDSSAAPTTTTSTP